MPGGPSLPPYPHWHLLQFLWQLLSKIVKAKYWTYWLLCSFSVKSVYRKRARNALKFAREGGRGEGEGACYFWAYLACTFARVEPKLQPNWISSTWLQRITNLALQIFSLSELRASSLEHSNLCIVAIALSWFKLALVIGHRRTAVALYIYKVFSDLV